MSRHTHLKTWAEWLTTDAAMGRLTGSHCRVSQVQPIAGPRAGALEMLVRQVGGAEALYKALRRSDMAALRQYVPWEFPGDPQVYWSGRYLRVEAGWSPDLARDMISLREISNKPEGGGRWVVGQSEIGETVVAGFNDKTPHWLAAGTTGSGKSVALRNLVVQLSKDTGNQVVLLDGKMGESLGELEHLRGVVGPCAIDPMDIRGALGWAAQRMRERYEANAHEGRIVVVFDEIQEMAKDSVVVELIGKLVRQGRAAGVHCVLATQHPTVDAFGDSSTRRMLQGKIALMVGDPDASRVAVGGNSPRADKLFGCGDSYAIAPGSCYRTQGAYVGKRDIRQAPTGSWALSEWPALLAEDVGRDLPEDQIEEVGWHYEPRELAGSIFAAMKGMGRPKLKDLIEQITGEKPGSSRAVRLLKMGRETLAALEGMGVKLGEAKEV